MLVGIAIFMFGIDLDSIKWHVLVGVIVELQMLEGK